MVIGGGSVLLPGDRNVDRLVPADSHFKHVGDDAVGTEAGNALLCLRVDGDWLAGWTVGLRYSPFFRPKNRVVKVDSLPVFLQVNGNAGRRKETGRREKTAAYCDSAGEAEASTAGEHLANE